MKHRRLSRLVEFLDATVLEKTRVRYRDCYNTRHSYISWSLMIGKNPLLLAEEDGHSVHTMLTTYARWTKGAREADLETIRRAMARSPIATRTCTLPDHGELKDCRN